MRLVTGVAVGAVGVALAAATYTLLALYGAEQITRRPRRPLEHRPSDIGPHGEEIAFRSSDGLTLRGWWFAPRGSERALVFAHGFGAHRVDALWGGDEIARRFVQRGYGVLLFDLRGHGASDAARHSFGVSEAADVLAALDFVAGRGVPRERTALIGISYGAATALLAAAVAPGLAAVVSDSAFAEAWPIIRRRMRHVAPLLARVRPDLGIRLVARTLHHVDFIKARPVEAIARLGETPVLLIHGAADLYIPPANVARLHAALPSAELFLVPGADHAEGYTRDRAAWLARVESFLDAAFARTRPLALASATIPAADTES
jgi:uncharacterized protein